VEYHEEIEYLISLLNKPKSKSHEIEILNRLEKLLEEYTRNIHQRGSLTSDK
jgi:hypothetical protein